MTGKLEIWHVGFSSTLFYPCIISCHSNNFCRSQAQKGTKNCNFAVFNSIKTDFLMSGRLEIWNVHYLPLLVCPWKISCQCLDFCRSHAQKSYKKSPSRSILQYKNILSDDWETWNLAYGFSIPVYLSMNNFMS